MAGLSDKNGEQRSAEIWNHFKQYVRARKLRGLSPLPLKASGRIHVTEIERETASRTLDGQAWDTGIDKINRGACNTNRRILRYLAFVQQATMRKAAEVAAQERAAKETIAHAEASTGGCTADSSGSPDFTSLPSRLLREYHELKQENPRIKQHNLDLQAQLRKAQLENKRLLDELRSALASRRWWSGKGDAGGAGDAQ